MSGREGKGNSHTIDFRASALEIKDGLAPILVYRYLQLNGASIIHVINGTQILARKLGADFLQQVAHTEFCVVLNLLHVKLHSSLSVLLDESGDQMNSFLVCCNLSLQVIQIICEASSSTTVWILSRLRVQQHCNAFLVKLAFRYQLLTFNGCAFLIQLL